MQLTAYHVVTIVVQEMGSKITEAEEDYRLQRNLTASRKLRQVASEMRSFGNQRAGKVASSKRGSGSSENLGSMAFLADSVRVVPPISRAVATVVLAPAPLPSTDRTYDEPAFEHRLPSSLDFSTEIGAGITGGGEGTKDLVYALLRERLGATR
jgi:hypothetical protein